MKKRNKEFVAKCYACLLNVYKGEGLAMLQRPEIIYHRKCFDLEFREKYEVLKDKKEFKDYGKQ